MFFKAWRVKKIADSILAQVQPEFIALSKALGGLPPGFATDKFVLGFFVSCFSIAYMREGRPKFDNVTQGNILFMVAKYTFGSSAPDPKFLGDLMNQNPPDLEFAHGQKVAVKLRAFDFSLPGSENDPDVIQAREYAKQIGTGMDFLTGPDPDGRIATGSMLLQSLLWRPIFERYKVKP